MQCIVDAFNTLKIKHDNFTRNASITNNKHSRTSDKILR